jgi:outer membrane protein assembly factor BamB
LLVATAVGCASNGGNREPKPLQAFDSLVSVAQVWKTNLDGEVGDALRLAASGQLVASATTDGVVAVVDTETGALVWQAKHAARIVAGAGFDGERVGVLDADNHLSVFAKGKLLWSVGLPARSYTPPLIAGGRVFVLLSDRRLAAFDQETGAQLWLRRYGDSALVLANPGLLTAVGNTLAVGLGEKFAAVNPDNGALLWATPLVRPRGAEDIERLADWVDGAVFAGTRVCGQAFQNAIGCLDLSTRRVEWTVPFTGANGVVGDQNTLYAVDAASRVSAYETATGQSKWTQAALTFRGITPALLLGQTIVVGDYEGYLHWLSRDDGRVMARMPTDGSPIVGKPLLVNGTAVAITQRGSLFAWRPQ